MKIKSPSSPRSAESNKLNNGFYSFFISFIYFLSYQSDLLDMEMKLEVKLHAYADHCQLLENHVYLRDYCRILFDLTVC